VVNGGLGPCLVANGAWAVFSSWVVAQLTAIHGSVGLGFLPPQPCDYYSKAAAAANPESPDLRSHRNSIVLLPLQGAGLCCCLLPRSSSAADGLAPCLAPSAALTSPAAAAAAFPYSSCHRLPLQPPLPLAPSCSRRCLTARSADARDAAARP
jgi:hypothetical protein